MTACLYGRLEAVKFFLETAVQNMEEEEGDLERYNCSSDLIELMELFSVQSSELYK